jgi:hypothetical protein
MILLRSLRAAAIDLRQPESLSCQFSLACEPRRRLGEWICLQRSFLAGAKYGSSRNLETCLTEYPETQALLKVQGVGHITALTFILTLGKSAFQAKSGPRLLSRPCDHDAASQEIAISQLVITKRGNVYLQGLLIECANHMLRPTGTQVAGHSQWREVTVPWIPLLSFVEEQSH